MPTTFFSALAKIAMGWLWMVFGHRRQRFQQLSKFSTAKTLSRVFGFFAWAALAAVVGEWLGHFQHRSERTIEWIVVYTGFTPVPPGRYTTIMPNSAVNFLPRDRVCVAEPLPGGNFRCRTVQRSDLK
jgi:hypothetical protein